MLARERASQSGGERGHLEQQPIDALSPVGLADIDERIHVDVRIASVAEDDATDFPGVERGADTAHVLGEPRWRDAAVLDELHGLERGVEAAEYGARGVPKLPHRVLRHRVERQRHSHRAGTSKARFQGSDQSRALLCRLTVHLGKQHGLGVFGDRHGGAASARDVEKGPVEQLARARAGVAGRARSEYSRVERVEGAEEARRCRKERCETELESNEQRERPLAASDNIDEVAALGECGERVT